MKILLINDAATPGGGAEVLTIGLRDELRARGHDARLFASAARYGPGPGGADYSCFGTTSWLRTPNRVANVSAYARLRSVLGEFRPDVVHVRMFLTQLSPLILPLLRHVPTVYHATWYETICPTGLKLLRDGSACEEPAGWPCRRNRCLSRRAWPLLMFQLALFRRWRGAFDRVVANSETVARTLRAEGIEPVVVIPNGVAIRPPRPKLDGPPTISFAGRLSREKGIDVLLRAFAKTSVDIPNANLLVAGDGELRAEIVRLIEVLGIRDRISLLGHLPQLDLEQRLSPAWVHAVPSRPPETFGLTAAEAMMRGTAVVASQTGGLTELVENGRTGFLVPPGDDERLAKALAEILKDRLLAESMGHEARARALAKFGRPIFTERFLELYASLRGGRA